MLLQTVTALPVFLLGALAVLMRDSFAFSSRQLGVAVSLYFLMSALASVPSGHLAERVGAGSAMRLAAVGSGIALISLGTLVRSAGHVFAAVIIAGLASALAQPAGNLAVSDGISRARQGVAFGLKQAAVPTATLLAGVAVPLVAVTASWRMAFLVAAITAPALLWLAPPRALGRRPRGRSRFDANASKALLLQAVAAGCAVASATAISVFYVQSAVARGLSPAVGGGWLVFGSLCAVSGRVLWGWRADRRDGGNLTAVARLLGIGALGVFIVAGTESVGMLALGTALTFGAGWGWNGVFLYSVVRQNRQKPAVATAFTSIGMRTGGIIGPALFGILADSVSFEMAWLAAGILFLVAATLLMFTRDFIRGLRVTQPQS